MVMCLLIAMERHTAHLLAHSIESAGTTGTMTKYGNAFVLGPVAHTQRTANQMKPNSNEFLLILSIQPIQICPFFY